MASIARDVYITSRAKNRSLCHEREARYTGHKRAKRDHSHTVLLTSVFFGADITLLVVNYTSNRCSRERERERELSLTIASCSTNRMDELSSCRSTYSTLTDIDWTDVQVRCGHVANVSSMAATAAAAGAGAERGR